MIEIKRKKEGKGQSEEKEIIIEGKRKRILERNKERKEDRE